VVVCNAVLAYLVRTCYDAGQFEVLLLSFDNGFDDGRVVAAQVDEAVCYTGLLILVSSRSGRRRLEDCITSHNASKKADEAVYTLGGREY